MVTPYIHLNGVPLSEVEAKILALNIFCLSHLQIALFLNYKESTIRTYVRLLHAKLDVHCPTEMMRFAQKYGYDLEGRFNGETIIGIEQVEKFLAPKRLI